MLTLPSDLRFAVRGLLRSPGYAIVAVLTLALGIGANVTVFTLVNAVLLRPPAGVWHPERLVGLYTSDYSGPAYGTSSYPDVEEFSAARDVFAGVAAFAPRPTVVGDERAPERVVADVVSPAYFDVLGVRPVRGRLLGVADGRGRSPAVVISHDLWRRRFAADPAIVGRTLLLNGRPAIIVGVAARGFAGLSRGIPTDVWLPIQSAGLFGIGGSEFRERGTRSFLTVARLQPGVTVERARVRMDVLARRLQAAYPDEWTDVREQGRRITVLEERATRVPAQVAGPVLGFVALIGVTVGLVLLICCANVAGLALTRVSRRAREHAVRLSLGASRRRLVAQLLTESGLLAVLSGGVGVLATLWLTDLVDLGALQIEVPIRLDLAPDARVVGFALLATLLTGVVFGLTPALRASRADLTSVLKAEHAVLTLGRRRLPLQSVLVVVQMAVSTLLLVGSLLFVRALQGAAGIDPGFRAEGVLLADAAARIPRAGESSAAAGLAFRERLLALPGVRAVTWATTVPLGVAVSRTGTSPEGYQPGQGEDMEVAFNVVGPEYFTTLRMPLVAGRDFTVQDRAGSEGVIVVNEEFARRYWPGQNPLGRSVRVGLGPGARRVVGVVRTGRYRSLAEAPRPYVYVPSLQTDGWGVVLHVRTDGDPRALASAVRAAVEDTRP
ncbi:MAG TPA: ABC transporter permease, partial [Gemmatimonadaceae bacterium]|nr:ABC transporter permease [Gemmatimonadaceae bacterium]